jgi:hypothetical protein
MPEFCFDDDGNWLGPELDELDCDLIDLEWEERYGSLGGKSSPVAERAPSVVAGLP